MLRIRNALIFFLLFLLFSCSFKDAEKPAVEIRCSMTLLSEKDYPNFSDDYDYENLENSILKSLEYFKRVPDSRFYNFGNTGFTALHLKKTLVSFLFFIKNKPDKESLKKYIKENYYVFKSCGGEKYENVLFTGYYEPLLFGNLEKTERFKYPVYGKPSDIIYLDISKFYPDLPKSRITGRIVSNRFVPYYTRKEIRKKDILSDVAEPIVWVDNRIDLFFLEIQGSGVVRLQDGRELKVHYHSSNGHEYRSIGKYLVDKGAIPLEEISMQSIRKYLEANPGEVEKVLNYNPSFVFFKTETGGPYGSIGVELTPERSIATDSSTFPRGALCFIESEKPFIIKDEIVDWVDFGRFVLNQDTGGAIKGPGRVDIFMGNGVNAELTAGHLQHRGDLYFLVLKP